MEEIWKKAQEHLKHQIKPMFYDRFFRDIKCVSSNTKEVVLEVENDDIRSHLENRYLKEIQTVISHLANNDTRVRFFVPGEHLKPAVPRTRTAAVENRMNPVPPVQHIESVNNPMDIFDSNTINPRYTFAEFICGSSNRLSYEACKAVVENPGTVYNPLYIFGRPGLGKTHLLHSVANALRQDRPWSKIVYMQLDTFQSLWVEAIKGKYTESFKARMRTIDVLLIDDVHSLNKNATSTGEELFNTFNHLHSLNKQILLTSDRTPAELNIEERLRSRFAWGLISELLLPQYETRRVILESKAEKSGIQLPADVVHYMAEHIDTNIRFLEAAVNKVHAKSKLLHKPIDLKMAMQTVQSLSQHKPQSSNFTIEAILRAISTIMEVNEFDILSSKRHRHISRARHLGMYLAGQYSKLSKKDIAGKFNKNDHTTVIHAERTIQRLLNEDEEFRVIYDQVVHEIKQAM